MKKWTKKMAETMSGPDDKKYLEWCGIEIAKAVSKRKNGKLSRRQWHEQVNLVVVKLISLKDELARLGLLRTMHKLDLSTTEIGYEISDIITGKQYTVDAFLKRKSK